MRTLLRLLCISLLATGLDALEKERLLRLSIYCCSNTTATSTVVLRSRNSFQCCDDALVSMWL